MSLGQRKPKIIDQPHSGLLLAALSHSHWGKSLVICMSQMKSHDPEMFTTCPRVHHEENDNTLESLLIPPTFNPSLPNCPLGRFTSEEI